MRTMCGGWRKIGAALLAGLALGATLGAGVADAASVAANPNTVAPGGALTIDGADWIGSVTLVFIKDNTVLQAGVADAGPNGGPFSVSRTAPTEPGAWQVCADGQNLLSGTEAYECASFTVAAPTTTTAKAATTTTPPSTTPESSTTSTTTPGTTTSTAPPTLPPTTAEPVPPSTAPVVTVPGGADGITTIDESAGSTDGSGLSGLIFCRWFIHQ